MVIACSELNKKGRWGLNTRGVFGGASKLSQLQTDYASAMKPLGLQRGIKGSTASHKKVTSFYGALNNAEKICQSLSLTSPDKEPNALAHWSLGANKLANALSAKNELRIRELENKLSFANMKIHELSQPSVDRNQPSLRPRR